MGNATSGQVVQSNKILHSLEDPYSKAVERIEDEANKAAYMHHVFFSMIFIHFS